MMTKIKNSKGQYITAGQLAVRCIAYGLGAIITVVSTVVIIVCMFCL